MATSTSTRPESPPASHRRGRRRSPRAAWALVGCGLAVMLVGAWWVTRSPIFELRKLAVSGNHHVTSDQIRRLGRLSKGTNVLWLSTHALEGRLLTDPWIADARIERTLPGGLSIAVTERTPIAIVQPGRWAVAADGTILGRARHARLPLIAPGASVKPGDRLATSRLQVRVARVIPGSLRVVVRSIGTRAGSVTLILRGGGRAELGDASALGPKMATLAGVIRWARVHGIPVGVVDLRAPAVPALLPANWSPPPPLGATGGTAPSGGGSATPRSTPSASVAPSPTA